MRRRSEGGLGVKLGMSVDGDMPQHDRNGSDEAGDIVPKRTQQQLDSTSLEDSNADTKLLA